MSSKNSNSRILFLPLTCYNLFVARKKLECYEKLKVKKNFYHGAVAEKVVCYVLILLILSGNTIGFM